MLEVKDEIIDGKATYNITKNEDGTYSIELATPVIQEGTPLNKKLFDSIMENNIVLSDLDDLEILSGTVTNAGAGWNSVTFKEAFSGVPEVVAIPIGETYRVQIKSITATSFLYRIVNDTVSTSVALNVDVSTGSYYTGDYSYGEAHSKTTLVDDVDVTVSSATSSRAESTTSSTIQFSYIAIYNGKD